MSTFDKVIRWIVTVFFGLLLLACIIGLIRMFLFDGYSKEGFTVYMICIPIFIVITGYNILCLVQERNIILDLIRGRRR